jgi:hypothetical protein
MYTLVTRHKMDIAGVETLGTGGNSGTHLEWDKGTGRYRILCVFTVAYIGQTGCCIKTSTTDPS